MRVATSLDVPIETDIAARVDDVWAVVSDPTRMPEWLDEFDAANQESDGPPGAGTVIRYTLRGDRSSTFTVTDWQPGRRLAWDGPPLRSRGGGARPRGYHEMRASGPGRTHLVTRYQPELTGMLVFLRPVMKRWLRRQRTIDAQRLKELIEAASGRKADGLP